MNSDSFTFIQLCDPQIGMGGYEEDQKRFAQAVRQVNSIKPDFSLICGDLVDRPDDQSYADIKLLMRDLDSPCYCVPGNHDVLFGPYDEKHGLNPEESLGRYRQIFGPDYFSFSHKGVRFICVNTQLWFSPIPGETQKQEGWFENQLGVCQQKGEKVIVAGHHPLYLDQPDEPDGYYNLPSGSRQKLLELCERYDVKAILSGHTHRPIFNNHGKIRLVSGEPTSVAFRGDLGFQKWEVAPSGDLSHGLVKLDWAEEVGAS